VIALVDCSLSPSFSFGLIGRLVLNTNATFGTNMRNFCTHSKEKNGYSSNLLIYFEKCILFLI